MAELQIDQYCGGIFQTNGYLVRTAGKAWLFDAPEGITDWLGEIGVRPDGLILTHQHHDHILDVGRLQETFGCPVYAYAEPSEELTLSKRLEQMMGIPCPIDSYTVDHLLAGAAAVSAARISRTGIMSNSSPGSGKNSGPWQTRPTCSPVTGLPRR